jgi:hypothetical protein
MQGMARVNVLASIALMTVLALTLTPVLSPGRLAANSQFEAALGPAAPAPAPSSPYESYGGDTPIHWLRFSGGGYGLARLQDLAGLESHPDAARIRKEATAALAAGVPSDLTLARWREALDDLPIHPPGRVLEPTLRATIEAEAGNDKLGWRFIGWQPGTGAGVYLDLNGDGQEEFLVLFPRGSRLYARAGDEWRYAGGLESVTGRGAWAVTLADVAAGRVGVADVPWKDVVIGEHRLRVSGDDDIREVDIDGWEVTEVIE